MPRTKGSLNRDKETILADRAAAEKRRAYRASIKAGSRGRLPEGIAFGTLDRKNFIVPNDKRMTAAERKAEAAKVAEMSVVISADIVQTFDVDTAVVVA